MTPDEREKMFMLCQRIATEKDPDIFDGLVKALNELLDEKHQRILPQNKPS